MFWLNSSLTLCEFTSKFFKDKIKLTFNNIIPQGEIAKVFHASRDFEISESQSANTDEDSAEARMLEPNKLQNKNDIQLVSEVHITEVVSPDLIYVIPKPIDLISFKEKCRQLADRSVTPDNFDIKTYVLAFHEADGVWYRGIILERHELLRFKVLLLDHGTTEIFRKNNLRVLKQEGLEEPFNCYACKLFDIAPNGDKWTDKSKTLIHEIIDKWVFYYLSKKKDEEIVIFPQFLPLSFRR